MPASPEAIAARVDAKQAPAPVATPTPLAAPEVADQTDMTPEQVAAINAEYEDPGKAWLKSTIFGSFFQ